MKRQELAGMMKVARLRSAGDTDAAIHSVVETYKETVKQSGARLADIAKVFAHCRREHPGPFYGMDEGVLVGLLATVGKESSKTLAALIAGLAVRESARYTWHKDGRSNQYLHNGHPVFMTGQEAGCWICVGPPDAAEEEAKEEEEEGATYVEMDPVSIHMLTTMENKDLARNIKRFIAAITTEHPPPPDGKVDMTKLLTRYLTGYGNQLVGAIRAVEEAMGVMAKEGEEGPVHGLSEADALNLAGQLWSLSKAALVGTVLAVTATMADSSRTTKTTPQQRTKPFARTFTEHMLGDLSRAREPRRRR